MSYEIELMNCDNDYAFEYDTGYGVVCGDIYLEVEPVFTDESFDAYNVAGNLQSYGGYELTGAKVLNAMFYAVGNNGVELGEFELTQADLDALGIDEEYLVDKLIDMGAASE